MAQELSALQKGMSTWLYIGIGQRTKEGVYTTDSYIGESEAI